MSDEKVRVSGELSRPANSPILPTLNADAEKAAVEKAQTTSIPTAAYVSLWIFLSGSTILYNKWILSTLNFKYPVSLTAWHMVFATIATQVMARTTTVLDGRKKTKMNGRLYVRAILPIGVCFSLSLIFGNLTYLYLSVPFIQMLKATTPVAVLLTGAVMGTEKTDAKKFANVCIIVLGVIIASFGEIEFVLIGVIYQVGGIFAEAIRLNLISSLLNGEKRMDALVSLYYFAPICAIFNTMLALVWEVPKMSLEEVYAVGLWNFVANASVALLLNVSVVLLIGKSSGLTMTLCGVLKDVLLVVVSIFIWGVMITNLQLFGYSLALGGLFVYKTKPEERQNFISGVGRSWAEFGANRPIFRKFVVFAVVIFTIVVLLGGLAPTYAPEYDPKLMYTTAKDTLTSSH